MTDRTSSHLNAQAQAVVEQFKYAYQSPGLTDKVKAALNGHVQASEVFQIKQEIARLNNKCERILDFRWRKDDLQVEAREILGITHYLDQQSLKVFVKELKQYGNRYTLGVYEAVQAYFEQHKHTLGNTQKVLSQPVDVLRFGDTFGRDEERMNLAIPVTLFMLPPTMIEQTFAPAITDELPTISATTSNISRTGLKLKLMQKLPEGQLLAIRFDGLEKDLVFKQRYVTYISFQQALNTSSGLYEHYLRLLDVSANDEFAGYLKNLIFSHKHKYKVEIESTVEAVLNKGHEQYFVDQTRSFSLFVDAGQKARYWFENEYSLEHWAYFAPNGDFMLPALLDKDGVIEYLQNHHHAFYFVCRVKLKAQRVYLSALLDGSEAGSALLRAFSGAKTARLYRISAAGVSEEVAMATSTVPREAQVSYGTARFHRYSPQVAGIVDDLRRVLTFTPILDNNLAALLPSVREAMPQATQIMAENALSHTPQRVKAESNDARSEDRFSLQTSVNVLYRGERFTGKTRDVSSLGFSAQLEAGAHVPKGQVIEVRFDSFAERTTLYNLNECQYKVVHCQNGLLRAYNGEFPDHDGRAFWQRMTSSKLDNLKVAGQEKNAYGLSRALRNLASANNPNIQGFFHFQQGKPVISLLSLPRDAYTKVPKGEALTAFVENFRSWVYSDTCQGALQTMLSALGDDTPEQLGVLVLSYQKGKLAREILKARLIPIESLNHDLLVNALKSSRINKRLARVYAVRASLTRGEFKRYYMDEMFYVKRFAPHRYEELRRQLKKVKGILTFTDITDMCAQIEAE